MRTLTHPRAARFVAAGAILANMSGCFAVFIPGSLIDAAVGAPRYCVVPTNPRIGDTFTVGPDTYRVTRLAGESLYYCRNSSGKTGVDADIVSNGSV